MSSDSDKEDEEQEKHSPYMVTAGSRRQEETGTVCYHGYPFILYILKFLLHTSYCIYIKDSTGGRK